MRRAFVALVFAASACSPSKGELQLSRLSVDFGVVEVDQGPWRAALSLSNVGEKPLKLLKVETTGVGFSHEFLNDAAIQGGERRPLTVLFDPKTEGAFEGTLTVEVDDGRGPHVVPLVASAAVLDGTLAIPEAPRCAGASNSVDLGTVRSGAPAQIELTVTSTGTAPLTVVRAATAGKTGISVSGPFGQPLAPGTSATFSVSFDPLIAGAQTLVVDLITNARRVPRFTVSLCAEARVPLLCVPASVDLGAVTPNDTASHVVTATSCGNEPITLTAATLALNTDGFGLTPAQAVPVTLLAGNTLDLTLAYVAPNGLAARDRIVLDTDSPASPHLELDVGANLPPPCQLRLSNVVMRFDGLPTPPLRLENVGATTCLMQDARFVPASAGFAFDRALEFPVRLAPHTALELPLTWTPPASLVASATLELEFDFVHRVSLNGDAHFTTQCQLRTTTPTVDFGLSPALTPGFATVSVINRGTEPCEVSASTDQPEFSVPSGPVTLASGASMQLPLSFLPTAQTAKPLLGTLSLTAPNAARALTVELVANHLLCDGDCHCGEGETVAWWRFSPNSGSAVQEPTTHPAFQRTCERSTCEPGQVFLEVSRGTLTCVSAPMNCSGLGVGLDYREDSWSCGPCDVVVQYGGIFDGLRVCAPSPNMSCPAGEAPTFDAAAHQWSCVRTCNNGLYDQRMLNGQLVCVPC